jgi:integrase
MENKIQKFKKENNNLILNKVQSQLELILEGQKINRDEIRRGFIGLDQQNQELLKLNKQLTQQLETVVEELNQIKQEREEKETQKQARAKRKRLPKRDPMTAEIYKELIKEAEGTTYLHVRLRLALCLLAVTGVRINELLNIKVSQLKTLTQKSWIAIDRSKRGPSNHKAFLTKEGKKIIQEFQGFLRFVALKTSFNSRSYPRQDLH